MSTMAVRQVPRIVACRIRARIRQTTSSAAMLAGVTFLAGGLACGGSHTTSTQSPSPAPSPSITAFTCNQNLLSGQSGLLQWTVSGATSISIDQGIGAITGTSFWIHPTTTTTYTLTASNPSGTTTATCTQTVYPATVGTTSMLANIPNVPLVDGPTASARFNYTSGVALDASGNLYVTDYGNQAIRMISPQGIVTTPLANLPAGPSAIAMGPSGNVYFSMGYSICELTAGGTLTTLAGSTTQAGSVDETGSSARFSYPSGLAVDASENVYVSDTANNTIRMVTPQGVVTTLAGSAGQTGNANGTGSSARFSAPKGIVVGPSGNILLVDSGNWAIRSITPQGVVTTLPPWPTTLPLWTPTSLAASADGTLFVGGSNSIVKITPGGMVTTLAGKEGEYGLSNGTGSAARFSNITGMAVDASGNVCAADYQNSVIRLVTSGGGVSTLAGGLFYPSFGPVNLGVDSFGDVFMPDSNNTILKITPAGSVSAFAGIPNQSGSADGPGLQALFGHPAATAVDGTGNVYVTDQLNATIRKITPSGQVSTLAGMAGQKGSQDGFGPAARFNAPTGIAVDGQGNVYVTDGGASIRKLTPDGNVTTLAGAAGQFGFTDGTGASARFNNIYGIAVDASGIVFVADGWNAAVRKITPDGVVTTLRFSAGWLGSAGAATAGPLLFLPMGIALDGSGNVYVSDFLGQAVWQLSPTGIASPVPSLNAIDTLNFHGTGLAFWGGRFYSGSPWGVELISFY